MDNPAYVHPRPSSSTPEGGDGDDDEPSSSTVPSTKEDEETALNNAPPGVPSPPIVSTTMQKAVEAAQRGDENRLEECFKMGVKATDVDSEGCSLLHWAAINNHPIIVERLLALGADANFLGGILHSSPLHWAARVGNINTCTQLVRAGARVDIRDTQGYTPMHLAVQGCYVPIVTYFLKHHPAAVNLTDNSGMTPVMWCAFRIFDMFPLRLLVRAGANLDAKESLQGNTALHFAAQERNIFAVKELLAGHADPLAPNNQQETPLDFAKNTRNTRIVNQMEKAARLSGKMGSSCIDKVKDSQRIIKMAEFFGPGVFLGVTAVLCHTVHVAIAAAVVFVLAIIVKLKVDAHRIQHTLIPIGITVAEATAMTATWSLSTHWWVPWWAQIGYWIVISLLAYTLIKVSLCDPGTIAPSTNPYEDFAEIVDENRLGYFCYSCFVNRPPAAKHCSVCDRCVRGFDHHCPWLAGCVTRRNHREFILFVISVGLSSLIYVAACVIFMIKFLQENNFGMFIMDYPWMIFTACLASGHVVLMSSLFFVQATQIAQGVTTNEKLKGHHHSYPRHRGAGRGHSHSHAANTQQSEEGDSDTEAGIHRRQPTGGVTFYARNCLNFCAGNYDTEE